MKEASYLDLFHQTDWNEISSFIHETKPCDVERALDSRGAGGLKDFAALMSPLAGKDYLETMARLSHRLTTQRFGRVVRLFAPMYLSNECNNVCDYCGFSLGNAIPRKTLSIGETLREAGILKKYGFDHLLLVTGESGRNVGVEYLAENLSVLRPHFSNLSIEVQPLHQKEYEALIAKGLHGVLVYQETYEQGSYERHHLKGRKRNFDWRLNTPDRLGQAGIKKIGLGCLFGLTQDWRTDAYFAAQHLGYLERTYWKTTYSMSFPRLRPCVGEKPPVVSLNDRDMVQLLCAFRIFSHELELSLSTRESPDFRENLLPLGVTSMSAGSKTNPGGYANREQALEQFEVSDQRSPDEICRMLEEKGYDPIFKDWDLCYDNPECLKGTFPQEVAGKSGKRDLVEAS